MWACSHVGVRQLGGRSGVWPCLWFWRRLRQVEHNSVERAFRKVLLQRPRVDAEADVRLQASEPRHRIGHMRVALQELVLRFVYSRRHLSQMTDMRHKCTRVGEVGLADKEHAGAWSLRSWHRQAEVKQTWRVHHRGRCSDLPDDLPRPEGTWSGGVAWQVVPS